MLPPDCLQMFAYHVPLNPSDPDSGEWGTLVRKDRIQVGDRLNDLAVSEVIGEERVIHGSPDQWEVLAVEPAEDDGRRAVVKRKLAPDAVWDGKLVLRLVR